jgi:hypothetical protein
MKHELETKLKEDFPILYTQMKNADCRRSCMAFGIECGDGWFDIIYDLSKQIEEFNKTVEEEEQIIAAQVKEKFATLRFYTQGYNDKVSAMITEAENLRKLWQARQGQRQGLDLYFL